MSPKVGSDFLFVRASADGAIVMSVLRMIKLFGWEPRVTETIAETRENELKYIWKAKMLRLTVNCIKYSLISAC